MSYFESFEMSGRSGPLRLPSVSSIDEKLARLWNWDFSRVICKLVLSKQADDENEAADMVNEYKRYIELHIRNNVSMPMSVPVDPAWHTHILFTRDYEVFCDEILGHFLHHEPTVTDQELSFLSERYRNITIANYERQFGLVPLKWWPKDAQICEPPGCHSGCGDA